MENSAVNLPLEVGLKIRLGFKPVVLVNSKVESVPPAFSTNCGTQVVNEIFPTPGPLESVTAVVVEKCKVVAFFECVAKNVPPTLALNPVNPAKVPPATTE